jgi:SAM-dependent methyltransferase
MSDLANPKRIDTCACCGGHSFDERPVLWPGLVNEWGLSKEESEYINRQQGITCRTCGNNLRSIALARSILSARSHKGSFRSFVLSPRTWLIQTLEINPAGTLTKYLARMPRRTLAVYPEVDMQQLPYESNRFDLVIHSDTLEHVSSPVRALSECRRVLKPGGFCCFTIPIVVGRLTRSRSGLPPSYHGEENGKKNDFLVQTEYGSDFWAQLFEAGFTECRIVTSEFPSAQAIAARKCYP